MRVWSPRFRVSGFGFGVSGFGFRVSGFGFRVYRVGEEHDQAVDPNPQPCVQHLVLQV